MCVSHFLPHRVCTLGVVSACVQSLPAVTGFLLTLPVDDPDALTALRFILATLNNESNAAAANKTNFESLNGLMLVMFTEDTMVYPKESEWFQTLDDKDRKAVALEATGAALAPGPLRASRRCD